MESEIKAASALGKALGSVQGIPEDVKQAATSLFGQLESADLSVRDKSALARQATAQFGGFLNSGMQAEENASRQRLLDAQTREANFRADALETQQNNQGALAKALAANTVARVDGKSEIDVDNVENAYLELGGTDQQVITDWRNSLPKNSFEPKPYEIDFSDGSSMFFAPTSEGQGRWLDWTFKDANGKTIARNKDDVDKTISERIEDFRKQLEEAFNKGKITEQEYEASLKEANRRILMLPKPENVGIIETLLNPTDKSLFEKYPPKI